MVSPLSFRYALGLLLQGAEGETREELMNAVGEDGGPCRLCGAFNALLREFPGSGEEDPSFTAPGEDPPLHGFRQGPVLRAANSVWKAARIAQDFTSAYKAAVQEQYGADLFSFTPENAAERINAWASEKTEGLIPRLVGDGYGASRLGVILMNALYMKAGWEDPFPEDATVKDGFTRADGSVTRKSYMRQTGWFEYYADEGTQLVVLPLEGGIRMAFVIGNAGNLYEKIAAGSHCRVSLKIPKLDLETSLDRGELNGYLASRGVKAAFDPGSAGFGGMIAYPVWVDDIIQKTRLKTDENGAEAAAVTAVMLKAGAAPVFEKPVEFSADRPFSFFIYAGTGTGENALIFAGEIRE